MKRGVITLYVRAACPLCKEAEATLRALVVEQGVERIDIVDIESDASLHQRFIAEIPAIEIGDLLLTNASGRLRIAAFLEAAAAVDDRENDRAVTR